MPVHHLEQNARKLAAIEQHVIGPFEAERRPIAKMASGRITHGQCSNEA